MLIFISLIFQLRSEDPVPKKIIFVDNYYVD